MFLEQLNTNVPTPDGSSQLPSLFEMLMHDRMEASIKPALEYIFQALLDSYPSMSRISALSSFDEAYALVKLLLDRYSLSNFDSLATERIYGMKRVNYYYEKDKNLRKSIDSTINNDLESINQANINPSICPLTPASRRRSLAYAVALPYIKAKLDNYYQYVKDHGISTSTDNEQIVSNTIDTRWYSKFIVFYRRLLHFRRVNTFRRWYKQLYPFVHFSYEAYFFLFQWLYVFGDTPYFSPLLKHLKIIIVRRSSVDETNLMQHQKEYRSKLFESLGKNAGPLTKLKIKFLKPLYWIWDHSYGLAVAAIATYQVLVWMYSQEGREVKRQMMTSDVPIPPPPMQLEKIKSYETSDMFNPNTCPLCKLDLAQPTVCSSGMVYCWNCIKSYTDKYTKCPVTGTKCNSENLTRIYDERSV